MQRLVNFAGTILEINVIVDTNFKEIPKFFRDSCRIGLIWVGQRIEDPFSSIDRVSDDNDVLNILGIDSLINPIPDDEQLSLSGGNVGGSMNSLNNRLIV